MPLPDFKQTAPELLQKIQEASSTHEQLVGRFKLRATGMKRLLGSVDMDIIAKKPGFLYLSVDSFFKQPGRVITYDGEKLYGVSEQRLDEMLTLEITPQDFVDILLRTTSINPMQLESLKTLGNTLEITYRSGHKLELLLDTQSFEILTRTLLSPSGQLIYRIEYKNYPKRFELEARYLGQLHGVILTSDDARLNQGDFNEQLFRR